MRHPIGEGETIEIEVEIPSLAYFADMSGLGTPQGMELTAATIADTGAPVPGRNAWTQASEAVSQIMDGVYAGGEHGAHRFHFRVPVPESGELHIFKVSVLKTGTALDGSGARRDPKLHPTEQILIGVMNTSTIPDSANQQAPVSPIPGGRGAGRFTPGVNVVRATVHDGVITLAQENTPNTPTQDI